MSISGENPMATPIYVLEAVTDRGNALYEKGETVVFSPLLMADSRPVAEGIVHYKLLKNNQDIVEEGALDLSQGQDRVTAGLNAPGFIECRFTFSPDKGEGLAASIGAGFFLFEIAPSMPVPDDFDAFWSTQKSRLAEIPLEVKRTPLPCVSYEICDIQLSSIDDIPVSGYLAYKKDAADKSLPAVLTLHGAGVCSAGVPFELAEKNFLAININAHGLPNAREATYYEKLAAGRLSDYRSQGFATTREEVYFLGMFLRVKRAIEFITTLPQWDGKNLFLMGNSQGALQTFAGAYLDERITAIAAGVPAGSDLTGFAVDRVTGWPMPHGLFENRECDRQTVLQNVRYFDNMNFATRIKVPGIFSVGYIDPTCKPTTVYAVYNNYAGPKEIIGVPRMTHEVLPAVHDRFISFLQDHIR